MADVGVVLLGPEDVARRLTAGLGPRAVAASDAGEVAGEEAVVGVAVEPWPAFVDAHEDTRAAVAPAPYFAVQAWHRHSAYVDRLAAGVDRARSGTGDVHVLFTAPGPEGESGPEDVVFLRETAEAVSGVLGIGRRSIAWTSGTLGPSSLAALTALADAHGRTAVLRCSLDPLGRPDRVAGEAAQLGLDLSEAMLDPGDLADILRAVVATVVGHERLGGARP